MQSSNIIESTNISLTYPLSVNNPVAGVPIIETSNLGYGLGKIVRGSFDYLFQSWQKLWNPKSSGDESLQHNPMMTHRQGLRECVNQLDEAINRLCKSPHNPILLKKIQSLAVQCAPYLQLHDQAEFRAYQLKDLSSLEEKISKLGNLDIKKALWQLLPILPKNQDAVSNSVLRTEPSILGSISEKNSLAVKPKRSLQQSGSFPASFDLSTLDGSNGFVVNGGGYSVSTAGDLNGDGKDDFVLGSYLTSPGGLFFAGSAYVLFGQASGWPATFNLTSLNGSNGFAVNGLAQYDQLGISVSTAGDINGDGKDDLILGASGASPGGLISAGSVYVLFGQASGWPALFNLTSLKGSNGFAVNGLAQGDKLGSSVSTAGDLNGDCKDDFVLGAPDASPGGLSTAGSAYVLFGQASGWPAIFNLASLKGSNGFAVNGLTGDYLGGSFSTAGDLNDDGKADLVLGASPASPGGLTSAGSVYVLFGQASGWPATFNLNSLNGSNGFAVNGLAQSNYLGSSVSTAGDINGDGKTDLVLGAYYASPGGLTNAGSAYILFGKGSGWPALFYLATLNGSNGFAVNGLAAGDFLGGSISTPGDINGDGKDDLVLGASRASPGGLQYAGSAYVLFGKASGWPATFSLTSLNGTNGFVVNGLAANDELGVSTAGDINGDHIADLLLVASGGRVYVIFGMNSTLTSSPSLTSTHIPTATLIPSSAIFPSSKHSPSSISLPASSTVSKSSSSSSISNPTSSQLLLTKIPSPKSNPISPFSFISIPSSSQLSSTRIPSSNSNPISPSSTIPNPTSSQAASSSTIPSSNSNANPPLLSITNPPSSQALLTTIPSSNSNTISPSSFISNPSSSQSLLTSVPSANFNPISRSPSSFTATSPIPSYSSPLSKSSPSPSTPLSKSFSRSSTLQLESPQNGRSSEPPSTTSTETIGIAVGVSGALVLTGVIVTVIFLRVKKKGCFANSETSESRLRNDSFRRVEEKDFS